ncbi:hypothetical protein A3860_03165 [Niastella vici]|uniref:Porin n=1 Tax=Niastella vici TaxID=1703345 RepID=A0A1V9GA75_9BACT|nr:hypothetical protein [Niastella vici]OQP67366.1 hypothetical protein A3860_03165 [Niastella vici]
MRYNSWLIKALLITACCGPVALMAQFSDSIAYMRYNDKRGINVFETPKETSIQYTGLKVRFGGGFTQTFQGLKHENSYGKNTTIKLYNITPGFNTAEANLTMDVALADGIRLNLTSYLSSRHHNETWVKGGYIQFDKLPLKGKIFDDIMKVTTIKVGHMEINYGDQHFRRSDGGHTFYNPFIENYIMDAFSTEIGGEVYVQKNGFIGMAGVTNGLIKGNVDTVKITDQDQVQHKSPSVYFKGAFDRQITNNVRVRLAASYYHNGSAGTNGNTLYGGDRTGSNYFMVLEPASGSYSTNAFSGRLNPGFTKKIDATQFNAFLKVYGLEVFGTYEKARGRTNSETWSRKMNQFAIDGVYRFGQNENLFIGGRYNYVKGRLQDIDNEVSVERLVGSAGWFVTRNVMLKGEYVTQKYFNFPSNDIRNEGKFHGYMIAASVGF